MRYLLKKEVIASIIVFVEIPYSGCSQSSVKTPKVDFG